MFQIFMSHHEIKVRQGQIFFAKIEQIFKFYVGQKYTIHNLMTQKYGVCYYTHFGILYDFLC